MKKMITSIICFAVFVMLILSGCSSQRTDMNSAIEQEINSECDVLIRETLAYRIKAKMESGEITDDMIDNLSSNELFYIVMSD